MKSDYASGVHGIMADIYKVVPPHDLDILVSKTPETSLMPQHWCTGLYQEWEQDGRKQLANPYIHLGVITGSSVA